MIPISWTTISEWLCEWESAYFGGMFSGLLDQSATQSTSLFSRKSSSLSCSGPSSSDCKCAGKTIRFYGFKKKKDLKGVWTLEYKMLFYLTLTTSWAGHLHIKGYLTLVLFWSWWPVRTESTNKFVTTNTCLSSKEHTMALMPTYHRRNYLGWIHAVHPGGSFPCLHCG